MLKLFIVVQFFTLIAADMRTGDCFLDVEINASTAICSSRIGVNISRSVCCCNAFSAAWGDPCEVCPELNTAEYMAMCPKAEDFKPNNITVFYEDIDECMEYPSWSLHRPCQGGQCVNTEGSFTCICPEGYAKSEISRNCEDVDECKESSHGCWFRCVNTDGNYKCICPEGFALEADGRSCEGVDECSVNNPCKNGKCVNLIGVYRCECRAGFTLKEDNGWHCVDTRTGDCFLNVDRIGNTAVCSSPIGVNVHRSACCCNVFTAAWGDPCEVCPGRNTTEYMTLCPGGDDLRPNPITVVLEDIDECTELPGLCQGGKCVNVYGSFNCTCDEGYFLNEESLICEDVDECTEEKEVCGPGACVNSVGAYKCTCPDGYISIKNGTKCTDEHLPERTWRATSTILMNNRFKAHNIQCLNSSKTFWTYEMRNRGGGYEYECRLPSEECSTEKRHRPAEHCFLVEGSSCNDVSDDARNKWGRWAKKACKRFAKVCHVVHQGRCFIFRQGDVTDVKFVNGKKMCAKKYATIANVYSESHYNALTSYVRNNLIREGETSASFWIGLEYYPELGRVLLSHGSPAPFVKWRPGSPSSDNIHMGVLVNRSSSDPDQHMINRERLHAMAGVVCEV